MDTDEHGFSAFAFPAKRGVKRTLHLFRATLIASCRAMRAYKNKPPRLDRIFATYKSPLYFVTFCTWQRRPILACPEVQSALETYGRSVAPRGIAVGRYTVMPDHIHLFVAPGLEGDVSVSVRMIKRSLSAALRRKGEEAPHWQPGFFDRLLRTSDSYSEKWDYVRNNPVRAGLVSQSEAWPYQGEIEPIQW